MSWTDQARGADLLALARTELEAELQRYHADCYGWALSCCQWDRSEAEDVLQTSYLKVLDGRAVFGSRSSFKTWLFGVIRRTAAEQRRQRVTMRLRLADWTRRGLPVADPAPDQATALAQSDASAALIRALATLPRRQRELLHLVFYQDLTIEQASEVLGVSIGTARTHYERGKRRLRQLLGLERQD
jgi:RNA polymerase sigma factor (sigma-70 family)